MGMLHPDNTGPGRCRNFMPVADCGIMHGRFRLPGIAAAVGRRQHGNVCIPEIKQNDGYPGECFRSAIVESTTADAAG